MLEANILVAWYMVPAVQFSGSVKLRTYMQQQGSGSANLYNMQSCDPFQMQYTQKVIECTDEMSLRNTVLLAFPVYLFPVG